MFNNIFSKLPSFKTVDEALEVSAEADEAEAKRERIEFHRAKVRNGPAKFSTLTSGQIRRARQRDLNAQSRRSRRKTVNDYFATQRLQAITRAHLQAVGVIEYADPTRQATEAETLYAVEFLLDRFGEGDVADPETAVKVALQNALTFWQKVNGLEVTTIEWNATASV